MKNYYNLFEKCIDDVLLVVSFLILKQETKVL